MIKQRQGSNKVNIWLEVICQSSEAAHQGLNECSHTGKWIKTDERILTQFST